MKTKRFLLIGLFMATLAASGFAAYHFSTAASQANSECCFPGLLWRKHHC